MEPTMASHAFHPIPELNFWQLARFFAHASAPPAGCLEWTGLKSENGYGCITFSGKTYRAHRLAYWIANRVDPGEMYVCHSCDNPICVNPDHLWLGTNMDNQLDAVAKGRRPAFVQRQKCTVANAKRHVGIPDYCRKCGHHRVDDYVEKRTDRADIRRCRACNKERDARGAARKNAQVPS